MPKQHSSGGKNTLLGITKRGDTCLRTLRTLRIHGARAVIDAAQRSIDKVKGWLSRLLERRNKNVAAVAMANKNAWTVWALLAQGRKFSSVDKPVYALPLRTEDAESLGRLENGSALL